MPEPFIPEAEKNNRDVKPDSDNDEDFDIQIQKLLEEGGDRSKRPLIGKSEIKQYAINDMRIGRSNKKPDMAIQKLTTTFKDMIA